MQDLLDAARELLVVVVACRVAGPDDEINRVFDVLIYPVKGRIDQREGAVTVARLGAISTSRAFLSMACCVFIGSGIGLVEGVGMEV